jgi:hypothetical protein
MQQSISGSDFDEMYATDDDVEFQHRKDIDSRRKLEEYLEEKRLREFLEDDYDSYFDDDYE